METMPNWLMQRAFLTPDRTAIEIEEEKVTFVQLHEKVVSVCEHLTHVGVKRAQKVAVLMKNGMEMITVIHALSYIGAVAVLLNTRLSREELLWQMDDAEVVCLVTDQEFETENVPVCSFAEVMQGPKAEAFIQEEFSLEEAMTIIYTSGTTGNRKALF